MNMKRKEFTPKKELKDGNQLDIGRKKMNEKAFIRNTMNFHSIIKIRLCVLLHPL